MSNVANVIAIEETHMDTIVKMYGEAETLLDEIITELVSTKDVLIDGYEGLATNINEESIARYQQHMEFLKLCCEANKEQIKLSKESIVAAG